MLILQSIQIWLQIKNPYLLNYNRGCIYGERNFCAYRSIDDNTKKKKKDLNDYLGLTHSTYDNWKNGSSESFLKHIDKIAEFLNVTPNYLLRGSDTVSLRETKQKMNEDRMVKLFRSIPEKEGERLLRIVEAFVSSMEEWTIDSKSLWVGKCRV